MDISYKTGYFCPIAIKWSIPENRLKELKEKPGESLKSDTFDASKFPGVQYYFGIFPNGIHEDRYRGKTTVLLYLQFSEKKTVNAFFKIRIESANFEKDTGIFLEEAEGKGETICTVDELFDPKKRFIVNGELTIKIEGALMVEKYPLSKKYFCIGQSDSLCLTLWKQEESKELTIIVGAKEITAHKNVLAARSPVFAAMFQSGMKEAKENKVHIPDFSFKIVETAVKLCYHHSLVPYITLNDKIKLLQFFDKYEIQPLKDDLENDLIYEVNGLTVCRLANASLLSNASKLEKQCTEYLQICLDKKMPVCDFRILDKDFALNFLENAFFLVSK